MVCGSSPELSHISYHSHNTHHHDHWKHTQTHVKGGNKVDGFTLLTFSDASGGGVSVRSFIMSTLET